MIGASASRPTGTEGGEETHILLENEVPSH